LPEHALGTLCPDYYSGYPKVWIVKIRRTNATNGLEKATTLSEKKVSYPKRGKSGTVLSERTTKTANKSDIARFEAKD
jgi:hypothetical protein